MAPIQLTYKPAGILQILDDRAAPLQRLIERANTLGGLAGPKAAAEIRFIRLELTDPTRPVGKPHRSRHSQHEAHRTTPSAARGLGLALVVT